MNDGALFGALLGLCVYGFSAIWKNLNARLNHLEDLQQDVQRLEEYNRDASLRVKHQEEMYDPRKTTQAIVDGQIRKGMTFEEVEEVLQKYSVKGGLYPTVIVPSKVEKRVVSYRPIGGPTQKIEFIFKDGRLISWKDFNVSFLDIRWPRNRSASKTVNRV
jgi:hypothetical protein